MTVKLFFPFFSSVTLFHCFVTSNFHLKLKQMAFFLLIVLGLFYCSDPSMNDFGSKGAKGKIMSLHLSAKDLKIQEPNCSMK